MFKSINKGIENELLCCQKITRLARQNGRQLYAPSLFLLKPVLLADKWIDDIDIARRNDSPAED